MPNIQNLRVPTVCDVAKPGVVKTYRRVKAAYPDKMSLNLLWGLQRPALE